MILIEAGSDNLISIITVSAFHLLVAQLVFRLLFD